MKENGFKWMVVLFLMAGWGLFFSCSAIASDYIVARPGSLDHFVVKTLSQAVAGEIFYVKIEARDANENTITGFNWYVMLAMRPRPGKNESGQVKKRYSG